MSRRQWAAVDWYGVKPLTITNQLSIRKNSKLAAETVDVTNGLAVYLQMLEHDDLELGNDNPERILTTYQRECLTRLCITSLHQLSDAASEVIELLGQPVS